MAIIGAILDVMKDVGVVGKDSTYDGGRTKYNFRGVDAVANALSPLLQKHGIVVIPTVVHSTSEILEIGNNQTKMMFTRLRVSYELRQVDESFITCVVEAESMDSGDKSTTKAMSVAWRTMFIQIFALATGEADPDSQVHDISQVKKPFKPTVVVDEPPQIDPWSGEPVVTENVRTVPADGTPTCVHGIMKYWRSPKTGKEMYFCPQPKDAQDICEVVKI